MAWIGNIVSWVTRPFTWVYNAVRAPTEEELLQKKRGYLLVKLRKKLLKQLELKFKMQNEARVKAIESRQRQLKIKLQNELLREARHQALLKGKEARVKAIESRQRQLKIKLQNELLREARRKALLKKKEARQRRLKIKLQKELIREARRQALIEEQKARDREREIMWQDLENLSDMMVALPPTKVVDATGEALLKYITEYLNLALVYRQRYGILDEVRFTAMKRVMSNAFQKLHDIYNATHLVRISFYEGLTKTIMTLSQLTCDSIYQIYFDGLSIEEYKKDIDYSESVPKLLYITVSDFAVFVDKRKPIMAQRGKKLVDPEGEFFAYYNTTKFDLTEQMIYTEREYKDGGKKLVEEYSCLQYALIQAGVDINRVVMLCVTRETPVKELPKLCKALDLTLHVKKVYEDKNGNYFPREYVYGSGKTHIPLGLFKKHWFYNSISNISYYQVTHYNKKTTRKGIRRAERDGKLKDICLILIAMMKHNLFKPMSVLEACSIGNEPYKPADTITLTKDIEKDWEPMPEWRPMKNLYDYIILADFETYTDKGPHIPYCISYKQWKYEDWVNKESQIPPTKHIYQWDCAVKFLQDVPHQSLIYFHNLKYDFTCMIKRFTNIQMCEKDNKLYGYKTIFQGKKLMFRDSLKMIPIAEAKFSTMFKIKEEKEEYPYDYYTKSRVFSSKMETCKYVSRVCKKPLVFLLNCHKLKMTDDGPFDHFKYAEYYCNRDVEVLSEGFRQFRQLFKDKFDFDIESYYTISSVADNLMQKLGVYDECVELNGIARLFCQRCAVGGKVLTAANKRYIVRVPVQDLDGNALYPSSMIRIPGFPIKPPHYITDAAHFQSILNENTQLKNNNVEQILAKEKYYYIEISIDSVGKKLKFPLIQTLDENGGRHYDNECHPSVYVDKTGLESLIKFHQITYTFKQGLYFVGYNPKIREVMTELFKMRAAYIHEKVEEINDKGEKTIKEKKNPLEKVIKLLMNSVYGKNLLKMGLTKKVHFLSKKAAEAYINNKWGLIDKYTIHELVKYKKWSEKLQQTVEHIKSLYTITERVAVLDHKNRCHIGAMVLSMSKLIMAEVTSLIDDDAYYGDTDSLQVKLSALPKLRKDYKEKYERELMGEWIGQFKSDFDELKDDAYATFSIFLGKKFYFNRLTNVKGEDAIHCKSKGITQEGVKDCAKTRFPKLSENDAIQALYTYMAYNPAEKIKFNMVANGKLLLEIKNDFSIWTKREFTREVSFKGELIEVND